MPDYDNNQGSCCGWCTSLILTSGFSALFLWLSLRGSDPTCSIQEFNIPHLNISNPSTNNSISFRLQLKNGMSGKGVNYAPINLTFYYNRTLQISNFIVPAFYQGHKKTAQKRGLVEMVGLPLAEALDAVNNGSTVMFRVGLETRVKYKILFWYTKRHGLEVGGEVVVDRTGSKVGKKGIKLKSGVGDWKRRSNLIGMGSVVVFVLLVI